MDLFSMSFEEPVQTNVRAHQCGTTILLVVNLLLVLGSTTVLVTPHWCEGTFTQKADDNSTKIIHCLSYGPYEQCFTSTCIKQFSIVETKKSVDLFDTGCIKLDIHAVESKNPNHGHIVHCTEIFVGINIGLLLLSGVCYFIDITNDLVVLKLLVGIFTSLAGTLLLVALPLFKFGATEIFSVIPGVDDDKQPELSMTMGVTIEIGIAVGLATVAVGIFNIVRGRRIFRKKTAQQKLGFAFGTGAL